MFTVLDKIKAALAGIVTLFLVLVVVNFVMESFGEDMAPVWSCHTMGDRQCGPNSPWHGITFPGLR